MFPERVKVYLCYFEIQLIKNPVATHFLYLLGCLFCCKPDKLICLEFYPDFLSCPY